MCRLKRSRRIRWNRAAFIGDIPERAGLIDNDVINHSLHGYDITDHTGRAGCLT